MPSDTSATTSVSVAIGGPVPWTTVGISSLLAIIFLAQVFAARDIDSSITSLAIPDLLAFGALWRDMVLVCGDWWRVFTAPLLHGGILHIGLNLVAFFFAGRFIEQHKGGVILAGLLAGGGLFGALASLIFGGDLQVSVGASGGIMALIAAALLLCYTLPEEADTISGRSLFWRILLPSLIPTHSGIDYAAHFGGAIAGAGLAASLCGMHDPQAKLPVRSAAAGIITGLFLACALFGAMRLAYFATAAELPAPPANATPPASEARDILSVNPFDPELRLDMSLALLDAGRAADAESQAIIGLRRALTGYFGRYGLVLTSDLRVAAALARAASGDVSSARSMIDPECPAISKKLKARVAQAKLCP